MLSVLAIHVDNTVLSILLPDAESRVLLGQWLSKL